MSLILTGASGIGSMLFGGDDEYKMSPEQRKFYEMLMGEYRGGKFGYSAIEKEGMRSQMKESLTGESQKAIGSNMASLARRGLMSPGQAAGMTTEIGSAYGKAYGQGVENIELASTREGRRRKAELERALMGASQGDYVQGEDFSQGLGDMAGNWMQYFLMKDKKPKYSGGYYSDPRFGSRQIP